ncbi:GNAT family N-acetyltransferase [Luteibacter pinisoli]|uniref:GNAT family N-acetyltransferase n=1 Tax=Luteibacter pinisoli TaxID=2589080 RepID=A0A4Y5Z729_9GAMM|nr:GNAT family N-acetyltransferase [Luteibacter pinisoli]QDE41027.1 GNAT family N-acetyltransferase [Luteibacter pinisoli]
MNAIGKFNVRWVFGGITPTLRRDIVAFWMAEAALDSADEAWRRSWEVACVLEDDGGTLAGICTVALGLDDHRSGFGYLRIYIGRAHRHPGLARRMVRRMVEGFEALASEPGAPKRIVANLENEKIARRSGLRLLASVGFAPVGMTAQGEVLIERRLHQASTT